MKAKTEIIHEGYHAWRVPVRRSAQYVALCRCGKTKAFPSNRIKPIVLEVHSPAFDEAMERRRASNRH